MNFKNTVSIALAFNKKYLKYACVSLCSIVANSRDDRKYEIYALLSETIAEEDLNCLIEVISKDNFKLNIINIAQSLSSNSLDTPGYFSKDIYSRLLLPEVLKNINKIVYVDCDTIFERDTSELYDTDLLGKSVAGALDIGIHWHIQHEPIVTFNGSPVDIPQYFDNAGLTNLSSYINSGILILDLHRLRQIDFTRRALDLAERNNYIFPDQDIINLLLGDDLVKIDPRWNIYPPARTHNSSDYLIKHYQNQHIDWTRPFAIHYTGTEKPWMSKDCMFYENFWKYAEMTSIYTQMLAEFKSCSIERIPLFT